MENPALASQRPLVIVVEDDYEMNELQRELLSLHGLDSVPAYSGAEALDLMDHRNADAVWLDVMLPEMDGFETCRRLRKTGGGRLPIVMVTALAGADGRGRGFDAGADAYFAKPFDPDEVIDAICKLIERDSGDGVETD